MDRIGIAWIFVTKNLEEELFWLLEKLIEARKDGYLPMNIAHDEFYSFNNPGKTKIIVIFEKDLHNEYYKKDGGT